MEVIKKMHCKFLMIHCLLLLAGTVLHSCKMQLYSGLSEIEAASTNADQVVEVALVTKRSAYVTAFFNSLAEAKKIHHYVLEQAVDELGLAVSEEISLQRPGTGVRRDPGGVAINDTIIDIYIGVTAGSRVFIYLKDFKSGVAEKHWQPFASFPQTLLANSSQGRPASLEDKIRYYLDLKHYEPQRIQSINQSINTVDFIAHFIPGYAGAEKAIVTGKSNGEVAFGVIEMVGDMATLGLGTKIRVVQKSAAAIVLTASTVRVAQAARQTQNGTADWTTGVDAFLATTEGVLATVTVVKINVSGAVAFVRSADEAQLVGRALGKSPDDILRNGLSRDDLTKLGVQLGYRADEATEAGAIWLRNLSDCISGTIQGFSLDSTDNVCELLATYSDHLKHFGFEYGWIAKNQLDDLQGLAGTKVKKKFLAALNKGMADSDFNSSGIKTLTLDKSHPNLPVGYTHELKINNSAARLLGRIHNITVSGRERTVLVFDRYLANGLH